MGLDFYKYSFIYIVFILFGTNILLAQDSDETTQFNERANLDIGIGREFNKKWIALI